MSWSIAQNPVKRVFVLVVGCPLEKSAGHLGPIVGCSERERFFVFEVMKERSFGYASSSAQLINGCRRVTSDGTGCQLLAFSLLAH